MIKMRKMVGENKLVPISVYDRPQAIFTPFNPSIRNPYSADGLWGMPERMRKSGPKFHQRRVYDVLC